jgi:phosphatidate cytidylyltransferase
MNMLSGVHPRLLWSMSGIFAILLFASLLTVILKIKFPDKDFKELTQRIKSWWFLVLFFVLALLSTKKVSIIFFAFISFLALKEYLSIIETRRADRRVLFWAYISIPLQYYWIWIGWYEMFIIFIPVYVFLFLPARMVFIGQTEGFLKSAGIVHWGLMKTVFCLSHFAYLLVLPASKNPNGGGPALVLFLVCLTQFNDIAQYIWGKTLGKSKVVPKVSPGKTWQGLIGGVFTTIIAAYFLGPFLTPMGRLTSLFAGLIIGLSGFIGDVVMSAVKRDLQLKDSGSLIPGHGGVLDRIDSLMYTAPLFFHYIAYFYY